jgi:hypothetical protein
MPRKQKKIEEYTRDSTFKTELKTKFNNKGRRLKNGRHLSATSMEVESSQALTAEGVDTGSNNINLGKGKNPNLGKSRSPTPAADDDEDILSISSRKSMSSLLTIIVGIVAAYLLL